MKYGLIGERLPHSFSKEIHAKSHPMNMSCMKFKRISLPVSCKRTIFGH